MAVDSDRKTYLPANDAWTGMLAISLAALLGACALLYFDWRHYADKPPPMKSLPPTTAAQDAEK
jgi:hypothetical protein